MHDLKRQDFRPVVCIGNLPVTQSTLFCMISSSEFSEPKSRQERQERRARLERESEIVKSQIQELKNKLPGLYKAGHNSAPSKQGNVSKKRPAPLGAETGDSKRQKLEYERARRVTSIFLQCNTIVKTLMKSVSLPAFAKVSSIPARTGHWVTEIVILVMCLACLIPHLFYSLIHKQML